MVLIRSWEENGYEEKQNLVEKRLAKIESDAASLKSDVALLKSGIAWLKHLYKSLDYRVWFLVAGVIITILIGLFT